MDVNCAVRDGLPGMNQRQQSVEVQATLGLADISKQLLRIWRPKALDILDDMVWRMRKRLDRLLVIPFTNSQSDANECSPHIEKHQEDEVIKTIVSANY